MNDFIKRYKNAKKAIQQIKNGEWKPLYNPISMRHLTAHREGKELWIGNGSWCCEISQGSYFGLFFRHYVWWAAARKLTKDADKTKVKCVPEL